MIASRQGYIDIVKFLVSSGANINQIGQNLYTSLIYASGEGHLDIVKFLVVNGANINQKNNYISSS
jgi:ankyrin repeat protein